LTGAKLEAQKAIDAGSRKAESAYSSALGRADATKKDAEAKTEGAKKTWWEWIGWGSKKTDETKRDAAANVANAAGRVEKEASKRA
jgi:hypothetical protein